MASADILELILVAIQIELQLGKMEEVSKRYAVRVTLPSIVKL